MHIQWFFPRVRVVKRRRKKRVLKTPKDYPVLRAQAKELVIARLTHFNQFYNFTYGKVTIRNQISRWGSCSSKGNLNFSYRILKLAPELQDYIVVHELCHLKEFNHGPGFWELLEEQIPRAKEFHTMLRSYTLS